MKHIYIFTLVLAISFAKAQVSCDGFNPTFEPTTNTWDWTDNNPSNWEVYHSSGSIIKVLSPFEAPLSGVIRPNVEHLYLGFNTRDNKPEDGWEFYLWSVLSPYHLFEQYSYYSYKLVYLFNTR